MSAEPVTIIAEAAQGYEGDETLARLLVRAAARGRADAVKFQLVLADEVATRDYEHYSLFRQLEMPESAWRRVAEEASRERIEVVFDVFGARTLALAGALGAAAVKIHSTDFFHHDLVEGALARFERVYFSTGGIEPDEVDRFLERHAAGVPRLVMLYGFQAEPTAIADTNLARLSRLHDRWPVLRLGFMDHAAGDADEAGWLGALALPFGICAIEKHVTLDRALALEDSVSALSPAGFERYVARIRAAEAALGRADLELGPAERTYREKAVKVVVARRALPAGVVLTESDVALLRVGDRGRGTPCHEITQVVGRALKREVGASRVVSLEDLR